MLWTNMWKNQKLSASNEEILEKIERSDEYKSIKKFLKNFSKKSKVIDGGCGLGEWVIFLNDKGIKTEGIDFSRETILRLKKKYSNYTWINADITKLKYKDESIDGYLSWGTFEHFEDGFSKPLNEAKRILKKNGLLIISVPFDNFRMRFQKKKISKIRNDEEYVFYQWRLREHELFNELNICGFDTIEINYLHKLQGASRFLSSLKLNFLPDIIFNRLSKVISLILPKHYFAHMLIAIAKKR